MDRYTWDEFRDTHTSADCCGYSQLAYVYERKFSGGAVLRIAADESALLYTDHAWGFTLFIPKVEGYTMVCSPLYASPAAAYELAEVTFHIMVEGGQMPEGMYVEHV